MDAFAVPSSPIPDYLEEVLDACGGDTSGSNADYVPQLASNGHGLFWSDVASLRWRDHTTGVTEQIAVGLGLIEGIAADENGVFFVTRSAPSDSATGSVFEVREQGVEQLATVAEAPLGIAIDPSAIYFVTIHGGMGSVNMLCRRSQRSP